jgi:hypothetical protein
VFLKADLTITHEKWVIGQPSFFVPGEYPI